MTDPFRRLEPPNGGWAATRERIIAYERRRFRVLAAMATAALIAVIVVLADRPAEQPAIDRGVHPDLAMLDPVAEPVRIAPDSRGHAGVLRVETGSPDVIFYHVMATDAPQQAEAHPSP